MVAIEEYERLRELPAGRHVMYQHWRSLLFLHFACDPSELAPLIPQGLEVDTFDGKAWVGLVPFRMEGIRPRFLPSVPRLSAFPETNVRTYVHRKGREPGVWFFSLDAASPLACRIARSLFSLPYHEATMSVLSSGSEVSYDSRRWSDGSSSQVVASVGSQLAAPLPGSLEFFLVERYLLYAHRGGRLFKGRVHHAPYPLCSAAALLVADSLVGAAGITPRPFTHCLFSPGVDVKIFPLEPA